MVQTAGKHGLHGAVLLWNVVTGHIRELSTSRQHCFVLLLPSRGPSVLSSASVRPLEEQCEISLCSPPTLCPLAFGAGAGAIAPTPSGTSAGGDMHTIWCRIQERTRTHQRRGCCWAEKQRKCAARGVAAGRRQRIPRRRALGDGEVAAAIPEWRHLCPPSRPVELLAGDVGLRRKRQAVGEPPSSIYFARFVCSTVVG